jgi:acyl-CoA synthetase (AMP-forming)/AMP-acid ligase II
MILVSDATIAKYTESGFWNSITLNDIFKNHAKENPDRDCFVDAPNKEALVGMKPERISYRDADRMIDSIATSFLEMGLQRDDVLLMQLPNVVELALSCHAAWRIGVMASPVPVQWRSHELEYIAQLTEAKALITVDSFHGYDHLAAAKELQAKHPSLKHIVSLNSFKELHQGGINNEGLSQNGPDANDIATLCYTSGTESTPKACPLSHNNWKYQTDLLVIQGASAPMGGRFIMPAPMVNMTAMSTGLMPAVMLGGTLILHHPFDPEIFIKQLVEEKINCGVAVPAMLVMILKYPGIEDYDLSSIKSFITGSAPPPVWALEEFKTKWNVNILNGWGQNEGTVIASGPLDIPDPGMRAENFPHWGKPGLEWRVKPAKALQTKIMNVETGKEASEIGEVGELLYKGPNVIPCYYNQPDYTKTAFEDDGFFHTGDLFQITSDTWIKFFDRKKDIIIRGGQNISAAEVENIVKEYPSILDAAAVDMPDERLGEKVCLYVSVKRDESVTLEDITSFMKEKGVAVYKLPERLEIIDVVPRNPIGKALKAPLRKDIRKKLEDESSG